MDATSYVLELNDRVTFSISSFTVYGSASNFTFTGLVPGRNYSISVTVNCTGESYVSGTLYDSTLTSYTIVTIINKTMTSITVSWMTSLPNAYYYWIYMTETISGRQIYYLFSFSNTYTLTNLVPGMNYSVYVTAYNGTSSQISDVVMDSTLPSYIIVTITNKTMTSITVSWMTSFPNTYHSIYMTETESGRTVYNLYSYSNSVIYTFTNLDPGKNYSVSVTAYNGSSQISAVVKDSTLSSYTLVTITNKTMTSITISCMTSLPNAYFYWNYMTETISGYVNYYLYSYSNTYTFTNLVPGRNYSVSVTAYHGSSSQISDVVMDRTLPPKVIVIISGKTETTMTISWTAPFSDIDYYSAYLRDTATWNLIGNENYSFPTTKTFWNLVADRNYSVYVEAHSGANSQLSDVVTGKTDAVPVPSYTIVTITNKTMTSITVSWITSLPNAYYYLIYVTETMSGRQIYNSSSNSNTSTLTNLVPARNYSVSVTAYNGSSYQISDVVMDRTYAVSVLSYTIVTITNKTMTSITVSWITSLVNVSYYWIHMTDTISERENYYDYPYLSTYTFTNLVPGRNYSMFVTANNGSSSQKSDVVMDTTLPLYTIVTITNKSMTSITFSWMTSLPNAYYYEIYVAETISGKKNPIENQYLNVLTLTDLVPGRNYSVSVTANNGSSSQRSDVVMDRTLPPKVNASVLAKTTTTMTISWPTNPWDVDYFIVILNETNTSVIHTLNVSSSPATFTYLVPGSNYSASVVSHSGRNATPSDIISDRTYPATVRDFYCFKYSTENISCSWSLPIGVWSLLYLEVINGNTLLQTVSISNEEPFFITIYPVGDPIVEQQGLGTTNRTFAMLGRLNPNTEYQVNITTHSRDLYSETIQGNANTYVGAPPLVPNTVVITTVQNQVTLSSLTVSFSCSWFQNTNGDLKYYTVIVKQSEGTQVESPEKRWPMSRYYDNGSTDAYQVEDRVYPSECSNSNSTANVQIGTGRSNGNFYDAPLKQNTSYRLSFRVYTYLPNARSIRAGGVAIYTDTLFSPPLRTLAGGIESSVSIVGPVVGGLLGALVIIVGGVLLYIRREQLNCFKRPDSTQTSTRKWDDLPAIPSDMKKDVCDASHEAGNEYVIPDDSVYEDLDNRTPQEVHHSGTSSKAGEDDAKTEGSSDPTYLVPNNAYVNVK
ncbi:receptor-type tyrosine-protein phosphatase beta-like isoform X2 [Lethenteron reissneri]|nr:receptor-type tyrosine-protein phosphatase beta-like isoform X2 [Lethenteron reissneri]